MSQRWLRSIFLDIGQPGTTGKRFEGLRITADIKMGSTPSPNEGTIEIFNPSADTITLAQRTGTTFRLWAGYGGVPLLVYQGDAVKGGVKIVAPGRDPTRVLKLQLQDGGRAYRRSRASVSYAAGVTLQTVYDDITSQMGLATGDVQIASTVTLPSGFNFTGMDRDALQRLSAMSGAGWTIRDGVLQVVPVGGATSESAPLLTPRTGLIGSPARKDGGRIEVTTLLDPSIRPLRPFRVESEDVTGNYVCEEAKYRIDSRGQSFYTVAVGRARG